MIVVDRISRKYFTSETSWLWDIDFELLEHDNIKKIVLAGAYASDLAERFSYTGIDPAIITVNKSVSGALEDLKQNTVGYLYAITCFSDKDKIIAGIQVEKPEEE